MGTTLNTASNRPPATHGASRRSTETGPRPLTPSTARSGGTADPTWTLTGREAERETVLDAVLAEEARSVVIVGAPGVGRTRLAREALARAREAGRQTRWATGTSAAAAVPFGAMAHLVPPAEVALDPFALLQRGMSGIRGDDAEGRPVVVIDDAHLLDELSVTLVQQLVAADTVTFVLTVRPDGPATNQLAALWKDGAAVRLDLQPLTRRDSDRLIATMLGGDVEARTGERLWRLSCGHPLFLRELVTGGRTAGQLRPWAGLWHWTGDIRPTPRLVEIVLAELHGVPPDEHGALEVLATGETMNLEQLVMLSSREAVTALERRGLVTVDRSGRRTEARMAHPLYAEVIRLRMPEAAASRIRRNLAAVPAQHGSPDELLRAGRAAIGDPHADPGLLTEAARCANTVLDHGLAERLARAALDAGAGIDSHLALLESVQWQGRPAEAERVAREATALVGSDDDRARLMLVSAAAPLRDGRGLDAEPVLAQVAAATADCGLRDALLATRALLAFESGRPRQAVELGTALPAATRSDGPAQPLASAAVAAGLAVAGRTAEALAAVATGWAALQTAPPRTGVATVRLALTRAEFLALSSAGRFGELEGRAGELHSESMSGPESAFDAIAALHVGWAALEGGRLHLAVRWLGEALAGFSRRDPAGLLGVCATQLAQAHAMLGEGATAQELLTRAASARIPAMVVFEPQMLLAEVWQVADQPPGPAAASRAQAAARLAADRGMWAIEAKMLHVAAQLGAAGEVVERLSRLAERTDSPLTGAFAEHAAGLAAGSGPRLDDVAATFEDMGGLFLAADAAAAAALAHQQAGDRRLAATSTAMATRLARAVGGPRTPALDRLAPPRLTTREEEVARLAVDGLNNQDIAGRLVLSVRTVETHLENVYVKLGVRGRAQLEEVMPSESAARATRPRPRNGGRPAAHLPEPETRGTGRTGPLTGLDGRPRTAPEPAPHHPIR
jgi:DNA-binding CsgD family transcriptional regulator